MLSINVYHGSVQFSRSIVSDSLQPHGLQHARLPCSSLPTPGSLLKLMSIELVMPSNHLILCHPCLLPSIFPSIRVFSSGLVFISSGQSIIMVSGEISMSHYHHRVTIAQNSELKVLESFRSSESIRYCEIHNTYFSVTLIFSSFPHLCMEVPTQSPCLGPRLKGTLWLRAGFPGGSDGKESAWRCRRCRRPGFDSWVGKIT